jgi:hypothetical protein
LIYNPIEKVFSGFKVAFFAADGGVKAGVKLKIKDALI